MSIERNLRLALHQLVEAIEYTPMGVRGIKAMANARKALEAAQQPATTEPMLSTDIAPRPLSYSLDDYHRAPSEGALHYTWQDKPHRLLYDLIAAVAYYAGKQPVRRLKGANLERLVMPQGADCPEDEVKAKEAHGSN